MRLCDDPFQGEESPSVLLRAGILRATQEILQGATQKERLFLES